MPESCHVYECATSYCSSTAGPVCIEVPLFCRAPFIYIGVVFLDICPCFTGRNIYMRTRAHVYTYKHTDTYLYWFAHTHTHTCVYVCVCICVCVCVRAYLYIYYIHVPFLPLSCTVRLSVSLVHLSVSQALYACQKRPIYSQKRPVSSQKRPICMLKETYMHVKRDHLSVYQALSLCLSVSSRFHPPSHHLTAASSFAVTVHTCLSRCPCQFWPLSIHLSIYLSIYLSS